VIAVIQPSPTGRWTANAPATPTLCQHRARKSSQSRRQKNDLSTGIRVSTKHEKQPQRNLFQNIYAVTAPFGYLP
jgi:hypothetical protein